MKILMFRPSFIPEISGGNHLALDLIEDLIKKGYEVILIVPMPHRVDKKTKNEYKNKKVEKKYDGKLKIYRIKVPIKENSIFSRGLRMIYISFIMFWKSLFMKNIDIIISHSMPIFLGTISIILGGIKNIPVIYWEQDILSESLITTGVANEGLKKKFFYNVAKFFEKISSKFSDYIITVSEKFKKRHKKMNRDKNIQVIYNWIDSNELVPISKSDNKLFDKFNLSREKFYVTYCGNLGRAQNVEILIEAAKGLEYIDDLEIVIFGDGVRRDFIKNEIKRLNVNNVQLFHLQPLKDVAYVYSLGDIGLIIGRDGTSKNGFPSKTFSIMAAEQAVISCFDMDSELSGFIEKGNCGMAIPPGDPKKLKDAIINMHNNKKMTSIMGQNAREFVKNNFSREKSTNEFIQIINDLLK